MKTTIGVLMLALAGSFLTGCSEASPRALNGVLGNNPDYREKAFTRADGSQTVVGFASAGDFGKNNQTMLIVRDLDANGKEIHRDAAAAASEDLFKLLVPRTTLGFGWVWGDLDGNGVTGLTINGSSAISSSEINNP